MTFGFQCVVTRGKKEEAVPAGSMHARDQRKRYWFFSNGESFPEEWIGQQWSSSTLFALDEDSKGMLGEIYEEPNTDLMIRLNTPRVSKLIKKIKVHIEKVPRKQETVDGHPVVTIHNLIATFEKMVAIHGDNARFWIT
jgi:hypothetical protein